MSKMPSPSARAAAAAVVAAVAAVVAVVAVSRWFATPGHWLARCAAAEMKRRAGRHRPPFLHAALSRKGSALRL